MDEQLEDLLALSRLSRQQMQYTDVDLSAMASQLTETLGASALARQATFIIEAGMTVRADVSLLRVVLDNLIGNAWKFTSLTTKPRIEFGCRRDEQEPVFFVRDNGVGFDDQHAERIFGAFQRLHSSEQFPGNGIGLSTVQRAIHRHGGRIWATASVGCGATFHFTVPEASCAPS